MNEIADTIINAKNDGCFLQAVYKLSLENSNSRQVIADEIVKLHNDKLIDAISEFEILSKDLDPNINFFLTREILGHALPDINAPLEQVMNCLACLMTDKNGGDMLAGMLLQPFLEYCASNSFRPKEAIELILGSPDKWCNFLYPSIMAGSYLDKEYYHNQTIRLKNHENTKIRKGAIFSLGKIEYKDDINMLNQSIRELEQSATNETDGNLLGIVIKSIFNLYLNNNSLENQVVSIIDRCLSRGDNHTLHAASELFGFNTENIPELMLDEFFKHLIRIVSVNEMTLKNIDFGIFKLLDLNAPKAIKFLEELLLKNLDELPMNLFDNVISALCNKHNSLLNKLATRWLLLGEPKLCIALKMIIETKHGEDIYLEVDPAELIGYKEDRFIFLARKSIGYLFFKPISAASIIVSLLDYSKQEGAEVLISLLFDPLMINYPGKMYKYLNKTIDSKTNSTKKLIQSALTQLEIYLKDLQLADTIQELLPAEAQREIQNRHSNRIMTELFKKTRNQSALLSTIKKVTMLYGRKFVSHTYNVNGQPSDRAETTLQRISTEMELPKLAYIDPFGIEFMLTSFRTERLNP